MIVAGIVLYNPEIVRLKENIETVLDQVDSIVFIDNGSDNYNEVELLLSRYNKVFAFRNMENLGIAKALNQIVDYAERQGAEWVLTLDQDSVAERDLIFHYKKYVNLSRCAIISCIIVDRNSTVKAEVHGEYEEIPECITSGCLMKVAAIKYIGGFDEKMFIDFVDFDICHTLNEHNYRIIRINYCGLLHEVGKTKNVCFLGKNEEVYNHSPQRKYYIVRNRIYFIRKHRKSVRVLREYLRLLKYIVLVCIYENDKTIKIKKMVCGIVDGVKMSGAIEKK